MLAAEFPLRISTLHSVVDLVFRLLLIWAAWDGTECVGWLPHLFCTVVQGTRSLRDAGMWTEAARIGGLAASAHIAEQAHRLALV